MPAPMRFTRLGYVLFVRDRTLMAQPFDEKQLEIRGQPFPIAEQVQYDELVWRGVFSSSFNGVLAYQGGNTGANSRLVMFDRTGKEVKAIGSPGDFNTHRISPDGQKACRCRVGLQRPELQTVDL